MRSDRDNSQKRISAPYERQIDELHSYFTQSNPNIDIVSYSPDHQRPQESMRYLTYDRNLYSSYDTIMQFNLPLSQQLSPPLEWLIFSLSTNTIHTSADLYLHTMLCSSFYLDNSNTSHYSHLTANNVLRTASIPQVQANASYLSHHGTQQSN